MISLADATDYVYFEATGKIVLREQGYSWNAFVSASDMFA
jgi:hypothetical protein